MKTSSSNNNNSSNKNLRLMLSFYVSFMGRFLFSLARLLVFLSSYCLALLDLTVGLSPPTLAANPRTSPGAGRITGALTRTSAMLGPAPHHRRHHPARGRTGGRTGGQTGSSAAFEDLNVARDEAEEGGAGLSGPAHRGDGSGNSRGDAGRYLSLSTVAQSSEPYINSGKLQVRIH